jgi:hypothetical protein
LQNYETGDTCHAVLKFEHKVDILNLFMKFTNCTVVEKIFIFMYFSILLLSLPTASSQQEKQGSHAWIYQRTLTTGITELAIPELPTTHRLPNKLWQLGEVFSQALSWFIYQ